MSASFTLTLSDEAALMAAAQQAMIGALTPEVKERMIQTAVSDLIKPSGFNGRSAIQDAFNTAIRNMAEGVAVEIVQNNPEIRAKITALLDESLRKMVNTDVDKLTSQMSSAFVSSLSRS